ncbi:methionine/alanine import family NSS transporter small subunit [Dietzia lutea]|nr:methionine/alanine import family NSS transporter small subunit [Dietzia lutea]
MDAAAITMMVLFLLVIWGGLALSIGHFVRHPDDMTEERGPQPGTTS